MTQLIRHSGPAVALVVLLALTGCTPNSGTTVTAPPAASATETEVEASAPATAPVQPTDCEAVLTTEGMAKLSTDGLEPIEPSLFDPLAMQMQEAGGLACTWGKPSTDLVLTVVQVAFDRTDESTWLAALDEAGYVSTDEPVADAFTGPVEPGSGLSPVAVLADGTLIFVSAPAFAEWIAPIE